MKTADIKRYESLDEAYLDLSSGRIDMMLGDSVQISEGFLKKADGAGFKFIGPDLTDKKWFGEGVRAACRKQDTDLVLKRNAAIEQIRKDGTYKKIQDKYFGFDVFGEE